MGLSEKQEIEKLRGVPIEHIRECAGSDFAEYCEVYGESDFLSEDYVYSKNEALNIVKNILNHYNENEKDKDWKVKAICIKTMEKAYKITNLCRLFCFSSGEHYLDFCFDEDNAKQKTYEALSEYLNR